MNAKLHGWYEAGGIWSHEQKILFVDGQPIMTIFRPKSLPEDLSQITDKGPNHYCCKDGQLFTKLDVCDARFRAEMQDPSHQAAMKKNADIKIGFDGKPFDQSDSSWMLGLGCLALVGGLSMAKYRLQQQSKQVKHEARLV